MEILRLASFILATTLSIFFFGIPSFVAGITERNKGYYPNWLCIGFIIFGIMMCVGAPCMICLCW